MAKPFTRTGQLVDRKSNELVYDVEIIERTRYKVRVLATTGAEACRKASDHFTKARTVAAPWSAEPLNTRVEALYLPQAERKDVLSHETPRIRAPYQYKQPTETDHG